MKLRLKLLIIFVISIKIVYPNYPEDSIDYFDNDFIRHHNYVYDSLIKTSRCYKTGWEMSLPIIDLNSDETVYIEFDDFKNEIRDFYYEIRHCDANWDFSDLPEYEYIEGFNLNAISNYNYSFNTLIPFIHYSLEIPNQDVELKVSGNYILFVYDTYEKDNLVFSKTFRVYEPLVSIEASAHQAKVIDYMETSHEVDVTVDIGELQVSDPYAEIKLTIQQNNRRDNAIEDLKPLFIKDNLLIYDYDRENLFNGLSEFRYFDIKSIRYQSEKIAKIDYKNNVNHIYLYADEKRTFKRYLYEQDINGKYIIEIQEADEESVEADYVWVYFTLFFEEPILTGNLYVAGELFDWNFTTNNRMNYNFEKKAYELKALLKQGYYNYLYAFLEDNKHEADFTFIEGNHFQTENDYIIYVYQRDLSYNYDKLVGYKIVNSIMK